jgi:hypothetical protein
MASRSSEDPLMLDVPCFSKVLTRSRSSFSYKRRDLAFGAMATNGEPFWWTESNRNRIEIEKKLTATVVGFEDYCCCTLTAF